MKDDSRVSKGIKKKSGNKKKKSGEADPQKSGPDSSPEKGSGLIVVGVGSSAGGLEALTEFVSHLVPTGRMSFVIAQHLAPDHRSLMHELLSRDTGLPIKQLKRSVKPAPDTIYLTPPNRHVVMNDGMIRLVTPKIKQGPVPSANSLFSSLARELGESSGAVVLSGTGSDGASGVEDVKKAGGITCAQDHTAKYDGMPMSARNTECVDLIASPADLGERLCGFAMASGESDFALEAGENSSTYESILSIVRSSTKMDFIDYRPAPLLRRMQRRMTLLGLSSQETYRDFIDNEREESELLANEFMIGVTKFFRDRECFEALEPIVSDLVASKPMDEEIRIWVPACSSGEEAYTLAIMFVEAVRQQGRDNRVRVFATDLDTRGLAVGRRGLYTEILDARIPDDLLLRYFTHTEARYTVAPELRDTVVFSKHDVTSDPPFSNMDLVSCRNLFIYFNLGLQQRTLDRFHYSLRRGGVLFLGRSENIGDATSLFTTIDKKSRIFRARAGTTPKYRPVSSVETIRIEEVQRPLRTPPINAEEFKAYRAIANSLSPPTIVIDPSDRPLHMHGKLDTYTNLPSGAAEFHIGNIIRPEFRADVRALITRARRDEVRVSSQVFNIEHDGDAWRFRIIVQPYEDSRPEQDCLLVSFAVVSATAPELVDGEETEFLTSSQNVVELEHELTSLREHMRTLVEELETSNEELQSLNEELQSSNEELQSTNEELETSNEELQATNEELTTVNEELNIRTDEARYSNSFVSNILETLNHPVIVTDKELTILRHNNATAALLGIDDETKILRSGADSGVIKLNRVISDLALQAISNNREYSRQIKSNGDWYKVMASPFLDPDDRLAGAIVILDEVTAMKIANLRLRDQQAELEQVSDQRSAILNSLPAHIALVDRDGVIVDVNHAWQDFAFANKLGDAEDSIGANYVEICESATGNCSEEAAYTAMKLREVLSGAIRDFEIRYPCHSPTEERWFRCVTNAVLRDGEPVGAVFMHMDETAQVELENSIKEAQGDAEKANDAKTAFLMNMSHELRTPLNAIIGFSDMQLQKSYGPMGHRKYEEYAGDINSEALRLLGQIEALLDVGKVESGTVELHETVIDVRQCQKSVFKLFEQSAGDKDLTLSASYNKNTPALYADEGMVRQMLSNLIGNSLKFTPSGGKIQFKTRYTNNGWFALTVQDTGIGIDDERIEQIRVPFG